MEVIDFIEKYKRHVHSVQVSADRFVIVTLKDRSGFCAPSFEVAEEIMEKHLEGKKNDP